MIHDRLLINDSKTELILIGSKQQLSKLQPISISVGNSVINNSSEVKNLGCWLDANLSMSKHITNICKSAFFYLHNIRSIKKYLHEDSLHTLVHAFITNRLDYCNSLLYGALCMSYTGFQSRLALNLKFFYLLLKRFII